MPSRREADMFACRAGACVVGVSGAPVSRGRACRKGRTGHEFMDLEGRLVYGSYIFVMGSTGGRDGTQEAAACDFQVPPRRHPPGTRDRPAF